MPPSSKFMLTIDTRTYKALNNALFFFAFPSSGSYLLEYVCHSRRQHITFLAKLKFQYLINVIGTPAEEGLRCDQKANRLVPFVFEPRAPVVYEGNTLIGKIRVDLAPSHSRRNSALTTCTSINS